MHLKGHSYLSSTGPLHTGLLQSWVGSNLQPQAWIPAPSPTGEGPAHLPTTELGRRETGKPRLLSLCYGSPS